MSPQLARRVAIVGTLSLGLFAILFFRLWFLQVLSSDQYAHAASRELRAAGGDRRAPWGDPRPHRDDPRPEPARLCGDDLAARPAGADYREEPRAPAAGRRGAVQPARARRGAPHQTPAVPCQRARRAAHLPDRLRRRAGVRAAAVRRGHGRDRHLALAALLPVRAPGRLPGRQRPADLPADLSARRRRVPGAGDRQPDHGERGQGPVLQGRVPERRGRSVGPGGLLRPLPARGGRRPAGPGRRAGELRRRPVADPRRLPATTSSWRSTPSSKRSASRRSRSRSTPTTRPTPARSSP